jgi:hypothetical protein
MAGRGFSGLMGTCVLTPACPQTPVPPYSLLGFLVFRATPPNPTSTLPPQPLPPRFCPPPPRPPPIFPAPPPPKIEATFPARRPRQLDHGGGEDTPRCLFGDALLEAQYKTKHTLAAARRLVAGRGAANRSRRLEGPGPPTCWPPVALRYPLYYAPQAASRVVADGFAERCTFARPAVPFGVQRALDGSGFAGLRGEVARREAIAFSRTLNCARESGGRPYSPAPPRGAAVLTRTLP